VETSPAALRFAESIFWEKRARWAGKREITASQSRKKQGALLKTAMS
jgi:hypothetical protein